MQNIALDKICMFCRLLKFESIKKEFDEQIDGYTLNKYELNNGQWICSLTNSNNEHITLIINNNKIDILKSNNNIFEIICINQTLNLTHKTIEKRSKGIVYSIIQKKFATSLRFNNEKVLVDLCEQRYIFTKEKLEKLIKDFNFDESKVESISLKLKRLEITNNLKEICDLVTEFSTHMNYYVNEQDGRKIKDNIYPTKTYFNGEDVSDIFDVNDDFDKLYRIFDLYRGIINPRNENDIISINQGFLSKDAFDLKNLKLVSEQENSIIGEAEVYDDLEYINYLKQLFYDKFGYKGDLKLDRKSILAGITYQMSVIESAKRQVEETLGISYEEFEKLDIDEQHKLIEQKTGKKVKPDYRLYIDGIPMDESHVVTNEQIDEKLEKITDSFPQKILKKIFKKKK